MIKNKYFRHFRLITAHRHQVIKNSFHLGIFIHSLAHDLSKYSPKEFIISAKNYVGTSTPIRQERINNGGYSNVANHHILHNAHHWNHYVDFYRDHLVVKNMPYKYVLESVADILAASKVYNGDKFNSHLPLEYFESHRKYNYMTDATDKFIVYCLECYEESGFKKLSKKETKAKYDELIQKYPPTKSFLIVKEELKDETI